MTLQTPKSSAAPHVIPTRVRFRVAIFAHNEERRIEAALASVLHSHTTSWPLEVYVLINGCSDKTLERVQSLKHPAVIPVVLNIADKCNAWNHYVHVLADDAPCHFFMDGDVRCMPGTLERMADELLAHPEATVVAGAPQSGRNCAYYRDIQRRWNLVYGNLYGVAGHRIRRIANLGIRLPLGLKGNDHIITQLLTGDLPERKPGLASRIIVNASLGYHFDSLKPFRREDLCLYWRRCVTYSLRKYQIIELEKSNPAHLPSTMDAINRVILANLNARLLLLDPIERAVRSRLRRLYPTRNASHYENMLESAS